MSVTQLDARPQPAWLKAFRTADSLDRRLEIEESAGLSGRFAELDARLGPILPRLSSGAQYAEMEWQDREGARLIAVLEEATGEWCEEWFAFSRQQSRGAWHLPSVTTVDMGMLQFPWVCHCSPAHSFRAASLLKVRVDLTATPAAMLAWSTLAPLFELVWRPVVTAVQHAGSTPRDEGLAALEPDLRLLEELGIDASSAIEPLRRDWTGGPEDLQLVVNARIHYIPVVYDSTRTLWRRWRTHLLSELINRFDAVSDKTGRATQKKTVSGRAGRSAAQAISCLFGGDWLAFLKHIGAEPHPKEQIVTALPEASLNVPRSSKIAKVAQQAGLDEDQVRRAATMLYGTSEPFPIEQRADALERYWWFLDGLWATCPVDAVSRVLNGDHVQIIRGEVQQLGPPLSLELERQMLSLWGEIAEDSDPRVRRTNLHPRLTAEGAFGPALEIWSWLATIARMGAERTLTAHRKAGIHAAYHQLGTLLTRPEKKLRPTGFAIDIEGIVGSLTSAEAESDNNARWRSMQRILTDRRHAWAQENLKNYLTWRWQGELERIAKRFAADQAKVHHPPSLSSFAGVARAAGDQWFGGDLGRVYVAIGEVAPVSTESRAIVSVSKLHLVRTALTTLQHALPAPASEDRELRWVAMQVDDYLRQRELRGQQLATDQLGPRIEQYLYLLDADDGAARALFVGCMERTLAAHRLPI